MSVPPHTKKVAFGGLHPDYPLTKEPDGGVPPVPLQVLGNKPAVTVMRLVLAAQKTPLSDRVAWNAFLDSPRLYQIEKPLLVGLPATPLFSVSVQHLLGGCEHR